MPGIAFLRAPFSVQTLRGALLSLSPMTEAELHKVLRWHCGLQEEWRAAIHPLGRLLDGWPAGRGAEEPCADSLFPWQHPDGVLD